MAKKTPVFDLSDPTGKPAKVRRSFYLEPEVDETIRLLAERHDMTWTEVVSQALQFAFRHMPKK